MHYETLYSKNILQKKNNNNKNQNIVSNVAWSKNQKPGESSDYPVVMWIYIFTTLHVPSLMFFSLAQFFFLVVHKYYVI